MNYYYRNNYNNDKYDKIDHTKFNKLLYKILKYDIEKTENKYLELSILINKFKESCKLENIQVYIKNKEKYKLRNINTYIKNIYGSFLNYLTHNNITYRNMICINN